MYLYTFSLATGSYSDKRLWTQTSLLLLKFMTYYHFKAGCMYLYNTHTYVQYVHTHTHTHLCVRVWHPTHLGRWSHSDLHQSAWSGVRGCHDSKQNEPGSHVLYINKPWENLYQSTIALWQSNESSLRTYVRTHVWPWKYVYTLCTYIHRHVHIYIRAYIIKMPSQLRVLAMIDLRW